MNPRFPGIDIPLIFIPGGKYRLKEICRLICIVCGIIESENIRAIRPVVLNLYKVERRADAL